MRRFTLLMILVAVYLAPRSVCSFAEFRDRIPNGYNVKDSNGQPWPGVGHYRDAGGGARNPFGTDFASAGFKWTRALCEMDSDGDGIPNGVELGDPDCVWKRGAIPAGPAISHPGFPGVIQGTVDTCKTFKEPAGARDLVIQLTSPVTLPTDKVTQYSRQAFNLSNLMNWIPVGFDDLDRKRRTNGYSTGGEPFRISLRANLWWPYRSRSPH